ncbi:hypothetical protein BDP27DRAFT_95067 [Rhodocollybia butyracea]|uniref:Uncharacterized protein n=1 Tax=Rhodocollybia butyracea TaxID=206335 RepID=A0A9P5Q7B8_9AGAR|nr:hypothetical protein BDP27DRAFT_95067 [Rhodocollybia butyracea]
MTEETKTNQTNVDGSKPPKQSLKSRLSGRGSKFWLYSAAFAFLFALIASELGLVSYLLHSGGNSTSNYPSAEYKHALGILLFACILGLLYILGHMFLSLGVNIFFMIVLTVFWGTGAGILFRVTPFAWFTCGNPASSFRPNWASYAHNCSRVVATQGIAWALWCFSLIMAIIMLFHLFEFKFRPNASMYGRKGRNEGNRLATTV